ncbi:hypothetical protein PGT21_009687 [Puccinia graminis f. sp. tritici]|uniref:Uncharacterized protein n=2 Tax=Puccinia graminis f. sp. tritici TaxID=56615 RepID=H6QQW4_PUCGT|nr:uncharacterized protein PGTG_21280 [Puccinia graminis f. sp. tritici CRL 75-36-700-3]EHS62930.1 hypothetical protein PGTG_21280 [Puccinia graminis f. sp. tritici CRL 75-36-700-3]KAA1111724.1 hypothetical protein PGT21_009687 [Puccinia graminis f. sp. tritici]KAA1129462.1 hypothetical protein PGTUg99_008840 [Puccinia graminis f. sp. tritici]
MMHSLQLIGAFMVSFSLIGSLVASSPEVKVECGNARVLNLKAPNRVCKSGTTFYDMIASVPCKPKEHSLCCVRRVDSGSFIPLGCTSMGGVI